VEGFGAAVSKCRDQSRFAVSVIPSFPYNISLWGTPRLTRNTAQPKPRAQQHRAAPDVSHGLIRTLPHLRATATNNRGRGRPPTRRVRKAPPPRATGCQPNPRHGPRRPHHHPTTRNQLPRACLPHHQPRQRRRLPHSPRDASHPSNLRQETRVQASKQANSTTLQCVVSIVASPRNPKKKETSQDLYSALDR
jgi:hypothetical protein